VLESHFTIIIANTQHIQNKNVRRRIKLIGNGSTGCFVTVC
jgi:hypothetical protein